MNDQFYGLRRNFLNLVKFEIFVSVLKISLLLWGYLSFNIRCHVRDICWCLQKKRTRWAVFVRSLTRRQLQNTLRYADNSFRRVIITKFDHESLDNIRKYDFTIDFVRRFFICEACNYQQGSATLTFISKSCVSW